MFAFDWMFVAHEFKQMARGNLMTPTSTSVTWWASDDAGIQRQPKKPKYYFSKWYFTSTKYYSRCSKLAGIPDNQNFLRITKIF